MKHKALTVFAVLLVLAGLTMLIVPRISNRVGEQNAHSTIEDFKALKSKATTDEPTEKKESDEDGLPTVDSNDPQRDNSTVVQSDNKPVILNNGEFRNLVETPDFDRLYLDSVVYNEALKQHQGELLVNEQAYQKPSLDLSSYGIYSGVYGYVSAPSIGMELPIYLGGNDDNMALGAAHMTYTSLPIGGESTNCVLSGHSGYIGRIFFDYIPDLNIGDEIVVENYWDTLTYKVNDKQINKSYESAACFINDGKDLLTLITCISNGQGGFDRFYVIAERN